MRKGKVIQVIFNDLEREMHVLTDHDELFFREYTSETYKNISHILPPKFDENKEITMAEINHAETHWRSDPPDGMTEFKVPGN